MVAEVGFDSLEGLLKCLTLLPPSVVREDILDPTKNPSGNQVTTRSHPVTVRNNPTGKRPATKN